MGKDLMGRALDGWMCSEGIACEEMAWEGVGGGDGMLRDERGCGMRGWNVKGGGDL